MCDATYAIISTSEVVCGGRFVKQFNAILLVLLATLPVTAAVSDEQARAATLQQSLASYPGPCPCPYNRMRNGRACGNVSVWRGRAAIRRFATIAISRLTCFVSSKHRLANECWLKSVTRTFQKIGHSFFFWKVVAVCRRWRDPAIQWIVKSTRSLSGRNRYLAVRQSDDTLSMASTRARKR